jgi:hypothetical protein
LETFKSKTQRITPKDANAAIISPAANSLRRFCFHLSGCQNAGIDAISDEQPPKHSWGPFRRFGEELGQDRGVYAAVVPSSGALRG